MGKLLWVDVCQHVCAPGMVADFDLREECIELMEQVLFNAKFMVAGMLKDPPGQVCPVPGCNHLCRITEILLGEDPAALLDEAASSGECTSYGRLLMDGDRTGLLRTAAALLRGEGESDET